MRGCISKVKNIIRESLTIFFLDATISSDSYYKVVLFGNYVQVFSKGCYGKRGTMRHDRNGGFMHALIASISEKYP